MSRPRVFYVLGSLEANDMGDEILSILGRLSRSSFEPRVVSLGGRQDLRERIAEMKVRVYPLGLSGPIGALLAVRKVRGLLRSMEADVVHGFGSWGGAVATVAAPPGVAVVRSITRPPASGRDLKGWILGLLEKRAARRRDTHFIVRTEDARSLVDRYYGGGESTVLPTAVDVVGIRERVKALGREGGRRHLGIGEDEVVFACVSPFHSESTVDEILQGIAVARRERPDIRFFLVGDGRYEASSRWKAQELHLDDSVVFLGGSRDPDAIWAAADAVVDASPWAGWSRGALVAQAAGLPVMKWVEGVVDEDSSDSAHPPRISGRADWFAAELVRLAEDPSLRRRIQERTRGRVEAHAAGGVAERLRDLYKRLG